MSFRSTRIVAIENDENEILYDGKAIDVSGMKTAILQVGYQPNNTRVE